MSQKRSDLETISHHAELDDLLLRPLSALRLPPTLPEREGWVDRSRLFGFVGRSRKGLIQLARQFGFPEIPAPSTGCSLTERLFSRKVHDLVQLEGGSSWDFELLKYGRHFRLDPQTKVIVGRREAENEALEYLHTLPAARSSAVLLPVDFRGPAALLIGPPIADSVRFAAGLVARHSNSREGNASQVRVATREGTWTVEARLTPAVQAAQSIASA